MVSYSLFLSVLVRFFGKRREEVCSDLVFYFVQDKQKCRVTRM